MRLDESVRGLSALSTQTAEFRLHCAAAEYTDTDEVWELIINIEQAIADVLLAWNNDKGSSQS